MKKKPAKKSSWSRVGKIGAVVGVTVCLMAVGAHVWRWWGPTPHATAWRFAKAWTRGDIAAIYDLMDNVPDHVIGMNDRRRPPPEGFERLMKGVIFPLAPAGTRWRIEVTDPRNYNFRLKTEGNTHWMVVEVRHSVGGEWKVVGRSALMTCYLHEVYHDRWPSPLRDPARERFRTLWTAAGGQFPPGEW